MGIEFNLGNDYVTVKASTIVTLNEHLVLYTNDGPIDLKVNIKVDFDTIPQKYHEVCLNMLTSKYVNKVSFGDNPFSQCKPVVKRKWWQFFKPKFSQS
jgi:hypothetical protein